MINKPTKIKLFGGSYVTMCLACRECRAKNTKPCEELWKSGECLMPVVQNKVEK